MIALSPLLSRPLLCLAVLAAMASCATEPGTKRGVSGPRQRAVIAARPAAGTEYEDGARGVLKLGLGTPRDGFVFVPASYKATKPAPLALILHGAGGTGERTIGLWREMAEKNGIILLAPDARSGTWDVVRTEFGVDVAFIDRAMQQVFDRYNIDRRHIAIGGFSDGASYALSLGLTNGDLFTHIIAFSPGFMVPDAQRGTPRVFVSHGNADRVLPVDRCSRVLVPQLMQAAYDVTYREFEGPHTVPREIANEAAVWFLM